MQRLTRFRRGTRGTDDRHTAGGRRELRLGLLGAATVVALLVAAGVFYVLPVGKSTYAAELAEAGSVKVGDSVRVAGVPVGAVTELQLLDERVRMRFTVDRDVFLGDQTTLEVRMLTAAGGHYVAVQPAGAKALGSTPIPAARVGLPYSLIQAFRDAAQPISGIDAGTLHDNLAALQSALTSTPGGIRQLGHALDSLVAILNNQNSDISRSLTVADEFGGMLDAVKSRIGTLLRAIQQVENVLFGYRTEVKQALTVTTDVTNRIAGLEPAWQHTIAPMTDTLANSMPGIQELGQKLDDVLASLRDLGQRLQNLVAPDGTITVDRSATTIAPPAVCIPLPGQGC